MQKILVSACLLGEAVRYDGGSKDSGHPLLRQWLGEGRLVSFCPEVAGGLGIPRPPSEIQGPGGGAGVLSGEARVVTATGRDVTGAFLAGAESAAAAAQAHGCRVAILKEASPSCGIARIHDGKFGGGTIPGPGVTATRLIAAGVRVFSELEIAAAAALVNELERSGS